MAVKNYSCEYYTGTEWFKNIESIINEKYEKGWEFVRVYSLRTNEYTVLFKKIRENGKNK